MKTIALGVLSVVAVCVATAAIERSSSPLPQPRVRLDPATRSAIPEPERRPEEPSAPARVILMERLVVKERSALPLREPAVEDPTGAFSATRGGRFMRRDAGRFRAEVGLWPWINIFGEEARFAPQATRVGVDVVRVKW